VAYSVYLLIFSFTYVHLICLLHSVQSESPSEVSQGSIYKREREKKKQKQKQKQNAHITGSLNIRNKLLTHLTCRLSAGFYLTSIIYSYVFSFTYLFLLQHVSARSFRWISRISTASCDSSRVEQDYTCSTISWYVCPFGLMLRSSSYSELQFSACDGRGSPLQGFCRFVFWLGFLGFVS